MSNSEKKLVEGFILHCDDWVACERSRFRLHVAEPIEKNLKKILEERGYSFKKVCDGSILDIHSVDGIAYKK